MIRQSVQCVYIPGTLLVLALHSKDLRKEFARLERLRLQTILKSGSDNDKSEARNLLADLQSKVKSNKRKTSEDEGEKRPKKTRVGAK